MNLALGVWAVVASIPFVPLLMRPSVVWRLHRRLIAIAESLESEASKRKLGDTPAIRDLRNMALWYSGAMPLIGTGILRPIYVRAETDIQKETIRKEQEQFATFFEANGWAHSHAAGITACVTVALFMGRPWIPRYWIPAAFWVFALKFRRKGGGVGIQFRPERHGGTVVGNPHGDAT